MTTARWIGRIALVAVVAGSARMAAAAGTPSVDEAPRREEDRGFLDAKRAVDAKDWERAVRLLTEVARRRGSDPDVFNLLGYAERNRGHLDAAFGHYERALELDPRHRGAREYLGEAWLKAGNVPKAEEQLAALERICGRSCEEWGDLAKDIAEYRKAAAAR